MLKTALLHPQILSTLGESGHGSTILIADGNYPFNTRANPAAERVYLNFMPGLLTAPDVLRGVLTAIPLEAAHVMRPDDGSEPGIWTDFRALVDVELQPLGRFEFYDMARNPDCALVIATAEQRIYANILLTIGVVMPDA
ncbi:MAG: RbsD or FucU transport [Chloroflexi bacterium]|nr:RbsD or FucU transport [Chloroflexota bacterium]